MTTRNDIEQLFRGNYAAMLNLANRMVHDPEVARDIVHDVFASLLTEAPPCVTPAYLLKGVRFACMTHIRNLSVRNRLNQFYAVGEEEIDDETWPDEEDIARLNGIVDGMLSDQCRRVVRLRFGSRMTYREIAAGMGISEVAVYKHLRHAMNVLRQNFNRHER